ncbi:hypothetical protein Nepgr_003143 [Nepenthes gracilis]|uniref:Uncharacterized protein n=1 Tax=Nepenthes gracilis TaxID=150966 RepID=A0AAD3XD09_NEPGR|nr:hypothetical protein Nepgr_003143 [Nepenthes gracilis]
MHGPKGENRERSRHMWSVPSHGTTTLAVDSKSYLANSFFKDVRKISVGDCALFKPPHDSPPFIGIIRWLKLDNENYPKLGVNWLYRPAEVKLGKGAVLEAAPNEVFYSFHRDEIPAASLLHPCKVAFLPKGVELLSGVSSFVCRRVYDTTNKCLWWLTDQDYINDRQGEVDKLLSKTRLEMHGTVQQQQQDCRSPKPMNGPTSTSHLKHSPDSVQNSTGSFPSQSKGKKKERNDQVSVPLKRECSSRANDGDVSNLKSESLLNSEIAKLTERRGLVDFEGVERLVQLMRPEKPDWKMDLRSRSLLAGVIASTDSLDCLSQFVQLRGLLVLDEWIQEVHKGRVGDSSSPKDSDRSAEDFLLVLLRALDKLPVNLNALQMCNIGKSVNNLRSYRNSEIQKKARSLVDMWKKRVEAEMTISDAKTSSGQPVTWPSRGKHEVSHGASRQTGGSSDAGIRSSYTQNSSKSASVKLAQGEANAKSSYASLGAVKPSLLASQCANIRDGQPRMPVIGGHSDPPQTAVREEKSSSSCSSDHGRNLVPSAKEDARSSTAGSASTGKITGSASKYRRSPNSLRGASTSCVQREAISTISSSLAKISASEKLSQSPVTCEKSADAPVSSHKLIVKIPSRGRSPAQSVTGGSIDDPIFTNSRASSPVPSEKNDQAYHNSKEKSDAYRSVITSDMNTESWQSNDLKDIGSDEGDGSPAAAPDCERCHTGDDMAKVTAIPKAASLSSENEMKSRKLNDSSFSSINALIESCEKYAEATEPLLICDDVGMNLLASVAAGEIPKSGMASPIDSSPATANEACMDYNGTSQDNDDDPGGHSSTSGKDLPQNGDPFVRSNEKSDVLVGASTMPVSSTCTVQKTGGVDKDEKYPEKESLRDESHDLAPYGQNVGNNLAPETEDDSAPREQLQSSFLLEKVDDEKKKYENQGRSSDALIEQEPFDLQSFSESMNRNVGAVENLPSENFNNLKAEDTDCDDVVACNHVDQEGNRTQQESIASPTSQKVEESSQGFAGTDQKDTGNNENLYSKETIGHGVGASVSYQDSTTFATENELSTKSKGPNMENIEGTDAMGRVLTAGDAIVLPVDSSDKYRKLKFDLNEGVNVEDGKCAESVNISAPGFPASVCLIGSMPSFSMFSASVGMPASVTVAAAAKGPFVPPEDLLRNKGEVGWKGSAATSAFRPAEPRKAIEIALVTANTPHPDATAACKQARPRLDIDLNVADERMLDDISCQFSAPENLALRMMAI